MKHLLYAAAGLAALAFAPTGAKAEDASWGCQVLLCAASQNPSWQGVPYCVPAPDEEADRRNGEARI